jgi:chorismate mutase/prephenate dehydrogenase
VTQSDGAARAELDGLRVQIGEVDQQIVDLIARRLDLAARIGALKEKLGLPVMDPAREAEVVRRAAAGARDRGADPELVRAVLWQIIDHARRVQE